jgi:membrane protease subunit (stomatin/prohibitin family)
MGLFKAFSGSISGTLADQWRDIITAGSFDEQTAVVPGIKLISNNGRGANQSGSVGVITAGSKIFVPENTAMFIFDQGGIESVVVESGGYEYKSGQSSIFDSEDRVGSFMDEATNRFEFGGQPSEIKHVAYVNLRELRGIKFGTRGPLPYHDKFYDVDLEILAYGKLSIRIIDPVKFVRNFLPPNTTSCSFSDFKAREQLISEFLQDFGATVNTLADTIRTSQLPSQGSTIAKEMMLHQSGEGSWARRFGIQIESVGIENIQYSDDSRELVKDYASNRMNITTYEGVSEAAANIAAQQKIAQGIQNNGFGDGAGMVVGMNVANEMFGARASAPKSEMDVSKQIELVAKLKSLLDSGILTESEFNIKKREIMGL